MYFHIFNINFITLYFWDISLSRFCCSPWSFVCGAREFKENEDPYLFFTVTKTSLTKKLSNSNEIWHGESRNLCFTAKISIDKCKRNSCIGPRISLSTKNALLRARRTIKGDVLRHRIINIGRFYCNQTYCPLNSCAKWLFSGKMMNPGVPPITK